MTPSRRIFLAHAREDKLQVRKLYADLKSRGLDPWLDEIDLMPGQIWKHEISKAIRQAGVFLACLSSRSVDKVGYVQNEFRQALSAFGERPPGSIYLIPIRLDDCTVPDLQIPDLGLSLKDIQWVDLWQEGGIDRLVASIANALTPSAVQNEAPPTRRAHEPAAAGSKVASDQPPVLIAPNDAREVRASSLWHSARVAKVGIGAIVAIIALSPWLLGYNRDSAEEFRDCEECPLMVVVPPGSSMMGSTEAERKWAVEQGAQQQEVDWAKPQRLVQIAQPYAVGKYEVTVGEFKAFVQATGHDVSGGCWKGTDDGFEYDTSASWRLPGFDQTDSHAVVCVSWDDAESYLRWLSEKTGQQYRLPSEAEWEYAARARTTTPFSLPSPDGSDDITGKGLANCARCGSEWNGSTAPVGSFAANTFGLQDTAGNVWEWVKDCWKDSYSGAPNHGGAWTPPGCSQRVLRGGSWNNQPYDLRSANRNKRRADVRSSTKGFRVARTLTP